ncbi:MAG TPA: DUF255 domain-containing protein [Gemmatimonadales bacterium]|nr:DUF255 domain-containing protein [Gemmatimonadales bacterium]
MRSLLALSLLGFALACRGEHANLSNEMPQTLTPYLAYGRSQPVTWQGWYPETFKLAGRFDRPILLAIGAGACRACAQMDRETYDDPMLAAVIDSLFIPVRVDADERPDLAHRYETAVNVLTGLRGYPLTVFLTPEGSAFFGGTYFPADDPLTGRGMRQILPEVARSFHAQHAFVLRHAALVHQLAYQRAEGARGVLGAALVARGVDSVREALAIALREHARVGTLDGAEGAALLFEAASGNTPADSSDLDVARGVLDVYVDSAQVPDFEDAPSLERAAALSALIVGWQRTADPRYREAARVELDTLVRQASSGERVVFTDREAFVMGALLRAGAALGDTPALQVAQGNLDTLLAGAYVPTQGTRHAPGPPTAMPLLLGDQVELASACLTAAAATKDQRYLGFAEDLIAVVERGFADPTGGYFDANGADPVAPAFGERTKQVLDGALPGANAAAAAVLIGLTDATHEPGFRQRAEATLEAFAGQLPSAGLRAATYLRAAEAILPQR